MKTIFISLLALLLSYNVFSQYTFSMYSEPYADLENSISLNNNYTWEFPDYTIPIGFDFHFFDTTLNTIYISSNVNPSVVLSTNNINSNFAMIAPFGSTICDRNMDSVSWVPELGSASPISYHISGDVGSRIFKLEWKNVGFTWDLWEFDYSTDYANIQLWCYENSNIIEFRYGISSLPHYNYSFEYEPGPFVAIFPEVNEDGPQQNGYLLEGSPTNPVVHYTITENHLNNVPPNGTVYRFTPTTASIQDENRKLTLQLFPNPTKEGIHINNVETVVAGSIFGTTGRKVKACNSTYIDCKDLDAGIYIVKITDHLNRVMTGTFIKER